jgi:calnexin
MFGPDKCGTQSKVHFIIKLKNPKNETVSEHHAPQPKNIPEFADRKSHLFTLKLRKDNSYEVQLDMNILYSGNLKTVSNFYCYLYVYLLNLGSCSVCSATDPNCRPQ